MSGRADGPGVRHVGRVDIGQGRALDQLLAFDLATAQIEEQPARHLLDARIHRARRTDQVDRTEGDALELVVVVLDVGQGVVGVLLRVGDREIAALHAEGPEEALAHRLLPGAALSDGRRDSRRS